MSCTYENIQIYYFNAECGWGKNEGKAGASLSKMFQAANILIAETPSFKTIPVYVSFKLFGK